MPLPGPLLEAIARESDAFSGQELARAVEELTATYREPQGPAPVFRNDAQRAAYLNARMPATYAACARVFAEAKSRMPGLEVHSLLDLGAGPGTALWAAAEVFPELGDAESWEHDPALARIGERIAQGATHVALKSSRWQLKNMVELASERTFDCVVLAYSLNESGNDVRAGVIESAWRATKEFLVLIEPGTPRGFEHILEARKRLIATGAHIAAPCPHENECPMTSRPEDWCHFSVRLERTALHRRLKQGELSYEDEKFSYLIAAREAATAGPDRVLRHPMKHSGHVQLTLCTQNGWEQRTMARSQKELYRSARKAEWGDTFPE